MVHSVVKVGLPFANLFLKANGTEANLGPKTQPLSSSSSLPNTARLSLPGVWKWKKKGSVNPWEPVFFLILKTGEGLTVSYHKRHRDRKNRRKNKRFEGHKSHFCSFLLVLLRHLFCWLLARPWSGYYDSEPRTEKNDLPNCFSETGITFCQACLSLAVIP